LIHQLLVQCNKNIAPHKNTMVQRSGSPCQIQGTLSGGRVINTERFAQLFLPLVWPVPAPAR
ncbi:MAG: hypothetical protein WCC80_12335, partial [Pseudolabrys sp.]